ncbi:MAG: hypothetical protein IPO92_15765 [Saprospiraceae bacterium]|nr:hypothetical protein [Saprospiraceae bacterium]
MKYFIRISVLLFFIFHHFGCKNKSHSYKPTTTIIEGQITSPEGPVVSLKGINEIKSTLDQAGNFLSRLNLISGIYTLILLVSFGMYLSFRAIGFKLQETTETSEELYSK